MSQNEAKTGEDKRGTGLSYALVTPARNEEQYIEKTIRSVISQTVLPAKWVIVSDGSTDRTDEIVTGYASDHPWMELVRRPGQRERDFASKVRTFNAGYGVLNGISFDIIGNLDADISFDESYFEFLLSKFSEFPGLGVAGTPFIEGDSSYDYRFTNIEHVSGACQLFRRKCFDDIGGYVPVKGGGIDWTAVTTARMKGWMTRTFTEKACFHHRKMGTGNKAGVAAFFRHGKKDYTLGGHPVWQVFRAAYQMTRKPYVIGGALMLAGYAWAGMTGTDRAVSNELIQFNRREQMRRLRHVFTRGINHSERPMAGG